MDFSAYLEEKRRVVDGYLDRVVPADTAPPETLHQAMRYSLFAGGKRVSHDGYEFMNTLYTQRFSDWLSGIPFYFYVVFTAVKLPVLTVLGFLVGLPPHPSRPWRQAGADHRLRRLE